jgi:phosphoadenosine phosphosulfate reductase
MTRLINEKYPKGVLTFIGQRRYESDARERKGNVWKNPWVPGQIGASPVQEWTALDVWLYILKKGVGYNPLYEKGFNRIGCFLCPSIDLHERDLMRSTELDDGPWRAFLEEWRQKNDLPTEWATYGFHRFKRIPPYMRELQEKLGLDLTCSVSSGGEDPVRFVEGHKSCDTGISREGALSRSVPWDRYVMLANILGSIRPMEGVEGIDIVPNGWDWKKSAIESFRDGAIIVRGHLNPELEVRCNNLRSIVLRAAFCVGCGVCAGRCPVQALSVEPRGKRIVLDPSICVHCGSCLGPCPAETFRTAPASDPLAQDG